MTTTNQPKEGEMFTIVETRRDGGKWWFDGYATPERAEEEAVQLRAFHVGRTYTVVATDFSNR